MAKPEDFTPEFYRKNHISSIQITLDTLHCNARCEFCYLPPILQRKSGDPGVPFRNNPEAFALLDAFVVNFGNSRKASELPMRPVDFIGGEVAMYPHNLAMIKDWFRRSPNLRFLFITNGLFFRKNWAQFAVESDSEVQFSLNGFDNESHQDRMKMGETWDAVLTNLKVYLAMTTKTVLVSFVMSPKTVREGYYQKIGKFLKEEFLEQGFTNIKACYNINSADPEISVEPTFNTRSFVRDDQMIKDFLEVDFSEMVQDKLIYDMDLYRIMLAMQATPEEIDQRLKVITEPWARRPQEVLKKLAEVQETPYEDMLKSFVLTQVE